MSPDLDKALCEKYPKLFAQRHKSELETAMCWGFECGDGWYTLIDALCSLLQWDIDYNHQPQLEVEQVKEKYGGLRFYVNQSTDRQEGAIALAESLSYRICEVCGAPGKPNKEGWIKTTCEVHKEGSN